MNIPTRNDKIMWEIWLSRLHLPSISVADSLNIFTLIHTSPCTSKDISGLTKTSLNGIRALLGVLEGLKLLKKIESKFYLTNDAEYFLLPTSPHYWGGLLEAYRKAPNKHSPNNLLNALLQTKHQTKIKKTTESWLQNSLNLNEAKEICRYMHAHSFSSAINLSKTYLLPENSRLLDVGAGPGSFSIAMALNQQKVQCIAMDLPIVCKVTADYLKQFKVTKNIKTYPADFFKDNWPTKVHTVLLSNILHDWEINRCEDLIQKSYNSLLPKGKIIIHEILYDDGHLGLEASSFSLQMLLGTRGTQFTALEISSLLEKYKFNRISIKQNIGYFWTVSAEKK